MAIPENGMNPKDKVVTGSPVIKMVENNEELNYNKDAFVVISDYVVDPGIRFLSESIEIDTIGCIHRDTVVTPDGTTTSTVFIPNVRLVPKIKDGEQIGHMYIGKNVRISSDPISRRPR